MSQVLHKGGEAMTEILVPWEVRQVRKLMSFLDMKLEEVEKAVEWIKENPK